MASPKGLSDFLSDHIVHVDRKTRFFDLAGEEHPPCSYLVKWNEDNTIVVGWDFNTFFI